MGGAEWMSPMTRATADSMRVAGAGMASLQGCGIGDDALEAEDAEVSPAGGEVGVGYLVHAGEGHSVDYTVRCSWGLDSCDGLRFDADGRQVERKVGV